jgi:ubiquinone/menaquinone biosynthesis C-methylase UbiE
MNTASVDDWDTHWEKFADAASRNPAQIYRHQTMQRLLAEHGAGSAMHLLDLGSGQGDFMVKAASAWPQASLCGFEMSTTGVEMTRRKLPGAAVFVVDLFQPPAEAVPYRHWATHAVCSEVLEHVDEPAEFLQAARTYLADGATLVVTVPGGPMSAYDRHIGHRRHFTRESLTRYLEEGGFTVEKVFLAGFPFFNLYRMTVIARGEKLVAEVQAGAEGGSSALAGFVMGIFRFLFRFNFLSTPFGWQVVAVARKASA